MDVRNRLRPVGTQAFAHLLPRLGDIADNSAAWLWFAQREAERNFPFPRITELAPDEDMYVPARPSHYFAVGRSAAVAIRSGLGRAGIAASEIQRILDLPCGFGRVMRMLRALWPDAHFTACDINRAGVDFCAKTFGAQPVYSQNPLTEVETEGEYDLVWVGSLLTHLDEHRWPEVLGWLRDQLSDRGALIFTTQGEGGIDMFHMGNDYLLGPERMAQVVEGYQKKGFGYSDYPEQPEYGISLTSSEWVADQVQGVGGLRLVYSAERGWDGHHDVVTCVRA